MNLMRRHPLVGHGLILAGLVLSIGVTRAVYVEPRAREVSALRADERKLRAQFLDLTSGLEDMRAWAGANPGRDLLTFHVRRALPAREMVPEFLRAVVPIANRHGIGTELIQPAGTWSEETVTDAAGRPVTYRRLELRFRLYGTYRGLGEYLREIESLDQLVIVRSVGVQYHAPAYPDLIADVSIWVYGTP